MRLRIGPAVWTIRYRKTDSDKLGLTRCRDSVIDVDSQQSPHSLRDTTLHETLHAVAYESGFCHVFNIDDDVEERMIRLLTPWLLGVLRDNPQLVTYLTQR